MKDSLRRKLEQLENRFYAINQNLANEIILKDISQFKRLSQELAEIRPIIEKYQLWIKAEENCRDAEEMMKDPSLREFAEEERSFAFNSMESLENELQIMLLPKDINDGRNIFLEIRAGTGGDESALFVADLLRMYLRYAERHRWKTELISESAASLGGYKEVIVRITGNEVYAKLKFESGVHRVQRVPITETQGRIHTSACTVAVLAEADQVHEVLINPSEIRIDTYRASGAGGQHINKTDSAVRITHIPTGLIVECQDDRSQHRNKDRALTILAAKIKDRQMSLLLEKEASERKIMVGSGDRSERIRTYNFPQGRLTDHRINFTTYRLDSIMDGDLDELGKMLRTEYQADLLASLANQYD